MSESNDTAARSLSKAERKAISAARNKLDRVQKLAVIRLFQRLLEVREMEASAKDKLRKALPDGDDTKAALEALQSSASHIKDLAWDDRTWPARVGIGAATVVAASLAGEAAGLALAGTAIAIPLWVVFGSGEDFAAALIADLEANLDEAADSTETEPPILEAEIGILDEVEVESTDEADDEPEAEDIGDPQPDDRDLTKLFYEIRDRGEEAISELKERGETFWQRINRETKQD
ncbi:MAG: hypothetical protein E2O48_01770 [Gemmatimonadetes bacterium]|nr:MAG: hypothetical protein E2O48_01770 [Gemmatimonadota bacterium]